MQCRRQCRQHRGRHLLQQWRSITTVRALLQLQGRAVARSLQVLRLKQAWQLWQRAHRAAQASRQHQYSKMVYGLLKVGYTQSPCIPEPFWRSLGCQVQLLRLKLYGCQD